MIIVHNIFVTSLQCYICVLLSQIRVFQEDADENENGTSHICIGIIMFISLSESAEFCLLTVGVLVL